MVDDRDTYVVCIKYVCIMENGNLIKDRRVGFPGRIMVHANLLSHRFNINVTPLFGGTTTYVLVGSIGNFFTPERNFNSYRPILTYVCTYT